MTDFGELNFLFGRSAAELLPIYADRCVGYDRIF